MMRNQKFAYIADNHLFCFVYFDIFLGSTVNCHQIRMPCSLHVGYYSSATLHRNVPQIQSTGAGWWRTEFSFNISQKSLGKDHQISSYRLHDFVLLILNKVLLFLSWTLPTTIKFESKATYLHYSLDLQND